MIEDFKLRGERSTLSLNRHGSLGVFDNEVGAEGASILLDEAQLHALATAATRAANGLAAQAFEDAGDVLLTTKDDPHVGRVGRVIGTQNGRVRVAIKGAGYSTFVDPARLRRLA